MRRVGKQRHRATFSQHDGTQDSHGTPTYETSADWDAVVTGWPCEMLTKSAAEKLKGQRVQETTTHVLYGEYHGAKTVTPDMKVVIDSVEYGVVSAFDRFGTSRELVIEIKREV